MTRTVDIERFLRNEGFDTPTAAARARAVLEEARLTRPGKRGMAAGKLDTARAVLAARLLRVCAATDCRRISEGREPVTVSPAVCEVCGGSNNRRAALTLAERLREKGISRLLVVGGTPRLHREFDQLLTPHGITLRCVDAANGSHSLRDATPDLQWAQVAVIWGASPLPHKVSRLYTAKPPPHLRVVKFARRGIEALCQEVLRSLG